MSGNVTTFYIATSPAPDEDYMIGATNDIDTRMKLTKGFPGNENVKLLKTFEFTNYPELLSCVRYVRLHQHLVPVLLQAIKFPAGIIEWATAS
jgi:hypothetical protein